MYSWIASFITSEEEKDNSLYAKQQEQSQEQTEGTQPEEWTWIEVIDDKEEDGLIIVQTDESTRIRNMQPSVNKRKRGISKSDAISRKVFKRSLYTDLPLMRRTARYSPRTLKRLQRPTRSLDVQLRRFYKSQQTTSEVLAATFPTHELFTMRNEFDCDISHLLNNTTFLKNILEAILKHKIRLNQPLQQWFDLLLKCGRTQRDSEQLSIEWKDTLSADDSYSFIEFRDDAPSSCVLIEEIEETEQPADPKDQDDSDDIEIIEVRYPLPLWMRKINVFECEHDTDADLKRVNVSNFHSACGECHNLRIHTCQTSEQHRADLLKDYKTTDVPCFHGACGENHNLPRHTCQPLTSVPSWIRRMDVQNLPSTTTSRQLKVSGNNFPSWMSRIDLDFGMDEYACIEIPAWMRRLHIDTNEFGLYKVPSWLKRIDLGYGDSDASDQFDYQIRGSNSWFSSRCPTEFGSFYHRHRPTSETSLLSNCQTLCNSVINFAMVLATATTCTEASESSEIYSNRSSNGKSSSDVTCMQKRKLSFIQTTAAAKHLATKRARKNKKWLHKTNTINKSQNKRQRYTPTSFSGRKSVRAC